MINIPYEFNGKVEFETYDEIVNRVKQFEKHFNIGKDESGEFDTYLIELGNNNNPVLFLMASMHATEWQATQYGLDFMEQLRDDTYPDRNLRNEILSNFCVVFVPVVNPYGFKNLLNHQDGIYAQFNYPARRNVNDIDLNSDFYHFTQQESINVKEQGDKYKPFAFIDMHMFQPEYNVSYGRRAILANGQPETNYIREEWKESMEAYMGEEITRWTNTQPPDSGLARAHFARQSNPHTPHTLSYITELARPAYVDGVMVDKLTDEEIYKYGMAHLYIFFKTSIQYYIENFKAPQRTSSSMYVKDYEGNEYALQATSTNEGETNGNQSFSALILPTKVNKLFINKIDKLWTVVDHDDVEHKIIYLRKKGEGKTLTVQVKGIPLFFDVLDNDRIYERYDEHMTAQLAFNRIFKDTGFTFVLSGNFAAVQWEGFGDGETKLETFQRALNRYKCEFRIVGNIVYLEKLIGNDTNHQYRHKLNASNIVQEIDASEMWTYAKGYGDYGDGEGGEDWQNAKLVREYTSPLAEMLGVRHAPPIKNGNITTNSEMDNQLKILVDESLKVSVTAGIHDLRKQNYPIAQSSLGDRVFLIDERIGLNDEVRIVHRSITRNWKGDVLDVTYTFGTPGIVKRHQSTMNTAIKNITDLMEGKIKLPYSVLDDAVINATKALQEAQTQLIFSDNGILAVDKNNPNLVTLFNSAGIGVSTDGGATFGQALTGQGINVDYVYTGTMLADYIAGGLLASLNGRTVFNLNDGILEMDSTQFILGGGADIHFTSRTNNLYYENNNVYGGIKFDHSLNGEGRPLSAIGVSDGSLNVNDASWRGLRVHSRWVENNVPGVMTNIISNELWLNENPSNDGGGWVFQNKYDGEKARSLFGAGSYAYNLGTPGKRFSRTYTDQVIGGEDILFKTTWDSSIGWRMKMSYGGESSIRFYPQNTGAYFYSLGGPNNRIETGYFNQLRGKSLGSASSPYEYVYAEMINGSVAGTSTHNSKMAIEDIDGQEVFDYFDNMKVKSFFYKDADISNRYNRKVSPVIEQLEIGLDNLYKASEDSLDINSNLFLLVKAFQHYVNKTDERLELLENEAG